MPLITLPTPTAGEGINNRYLLQQQQQLQVSLIIVINRHLLRKKRA